jgi:hypothetical protein
MRLWSSGFLFSGQMQVNGESKEPSRDANDRERDDLPFDSVCNLHGGAVERPDPLILYLGDCVAPGPGMLKRTIGSHKRRQILQPAFGRESEAQGS